MGGCCAKLWHDDEITGYYHSGFGRLVAFSTMLFLSSALVLLASEEAGCDRVDDDVCDRPVAGVLRPSSLLAVTNMSSSFLAACLMPLLGATIDRTPHRRRVGLASAYLLLAVNLAQVRR